MEVDFEARYRIERFGGIAFWLAGYVKTPRVDEETGEQVRVWLGECDDAYDIDTTQVVAVMVGDDREWFIDVDELIVISDDEYCGGCGQIGCGWH